MTLDPSHCLGITRGEARLVRTALVLLAYTLYRLLASTTPP